jgi:hypothetical protein
VNAKQDINSVCPFCGSPSHRWMNANDDGFDCPICNLFFISEDLKSQIENLTIGNEKLNCISENIRSNPVQFPVITFWHNKNYDLPSLATDITVKNFEDFARVPIIHAEKTNSILLLLASKALNASPFSNVKLDLKDLYKIKILNFEEYWEWIKPLIEKELILPMTVDGRTFPKSIKPKEEEFGNVYFKINPSGWEEVYQGQKSINSNKVFIAMQFNWDDDLLKNKFVEAVKDACKMCGFEANIVNQNHTNQITDEIISNIKESHFVIADFTYQNKGAYYEAGLARGLGLPVIHTVMNKHEKDLHFDIVQINYIKWDSPENLKQQLLFRIKAVLGSAGTK